VILRAAWVLPIHHPPIRDGAVRIIGDRIAAVGPAAELPPVNEECIDLGASILTPGLVNPHTHLELTCYRGQLAPASLWAWFPHLVRMRRAAGQVEREQHAVEEGAWMSLRAGVTCVGDISRRALNWQVLKAVPIRKVCYLELLSLADDPPRNLDELRAAVAETVEDNLLTAGITPHAPYTVPADQIRGAIELAAERRRPWCTHWAESREECAFLAGDREALPLYMQLLLAQCHLATPKLPAIEFLERCTRDLPPGVLAHVNYIEPGDAQRLAALGHTVVYCPRSHRFFGHAPHPFPDLVRAGVNVAIGTDSLASNEDLSLLEELRCVWETVADPPPPERLLEMITINAARGLGMADQIGTLEPGKLADLAAFPCTAEMNDPAAMLVQSAPTPHGVWIGGQRVEW
jgi:aminodeoxyfutalosine deaminase